MKQGPAKHRTEPKGPSKVFKPDLSAISRMGAKQNMLKPTPAATKKIGTQAPRSVATGHSTGSQGKHK